VTFSGKNGHFWHVHNCKMAEIVTKEIRQQKDFEKDNKISVNSNGPDICRVFSNVPSIGF